jgi:glycosyltransferase involved in cell wall biosynthesis
VLFVGRLVPYKGLDVLLHALHRHPVHLPLVIAGDGPQRRALESLAAQLGVRTRFLGRVSDQELPDLYRNAALTVLPSVNRQEAFGISLLESMACGTPVVASDLPGVAQLARLGGIVAPPGNAGVLGLQLRRALDSDTIHRGHALADPIHQGYSWEAVTDRLETVYHEVLASRTCRDGTKGEVVPDAHPVGQPVL